MRQFFRTKPHVILALVFFLGFLVRLYRFDNPVADWHSWRQSDTSAVSRIFVQRGFDILHPRYLDISNIQTGKNNPEGYRYVEFPIYNIFQASLFKIIGFFTIEEWGRLVTIASSLISGLFLYLLVKKNYSFLPAFFTLFFYLFLPFSIYYGRTILPDTMMVSAILGGTYFFNEYLERKKKEKYLFLCFSTILTAASFLLKPYALFFTLPQIYLAYKKYNFRFIFRIELWIYLLVSVAPLVWWRLYMTQFPEGIPASTWLFNGNRIRFRPSFFRWILYERVTKLIAGYFGIVLIFFGFLSTRVENFRTNLFAISFFASSLLYVCVIATGNVQHDYYQILIMPTVALFMGLGSFYLFRKGILFQTTGIVITIFSLLLSWNLVKDYFNINNPSLVVAGKKADAILPKNAKVIAPYDGDTTLLYYINRPGWPAFQDSVENLKKLGATHLVFVKPLQRDIDSFGKEYQVVSISRDYMILKL